MRILRLILVILMTLASANCAASQSDTLPSAPPHDTPAAVPSPDWPTDTLEEAGAPRSANAPTPDAGLALLIERATADLARRLGIGSAQIRLLQAAAVTWPDASLGCAQPGMGYAQVVTPGYLIRLEAGGRVYEYHADQAARIELCRQDLPPPALEIPVTPGDVQDGQPWVPVN